MPGPFPYVASSKRVPPAPPGYLTLPEAALRAGVSEGSLRQRVLRGRIPILRRDGHVYVAEDAIVALAQAYAALREIAQRVAEEQQGGRPPAAPAAPAAAVERAEITAGEVRP